MFASQKKMATLGHPSNLNHPHPLQRQSPPPQPRPAPTRTWAGAPVAGGTPAELADSTGLGGGERAEQVLRGPQQVLQRQGPAMPQGLGRRRRRRRREEGRLRAGTFTATFLRWKCALKPRKRVQCNPYSQPSKAKTLPIKRKGHPAQIPKLEIAVFFL